VTVTERTGWPDALLTSTWGVVGNSEPMYAVCPSPARAVMVSPATAAEVVVGPVLSPPQAYASMGATAAETSASARRAAGIIVKGSVRWCRETGAGDGVAMDRDRRQRLERARAVDSGARSAPDIVGQVDAVPRAGDRIGAGRLREGRAGLGAR
jgi:hypothetical protein